MDPKTKKKLIIGLSLTTILGVGGYFAYKWWKNNQDDGEADDNGNDDTSVNTTTTQTISPPSNSSSSSSGSRPGDVLALQKWANADGYTPKLVEDGIWGPNTKAAWNAKKSGYNSSTEVKENAGKLSGQLKAIYEKFMASSKLKPKTKAYSSNDVMKVSTVGDLSGKKYVYVAGGSMYVYASNGAQIAAGNYANNGLKVVVTLGPEKGKTFTGTSILKVANKASGLSENTVTISNAQAADIVSKMYYAMKGGGTYEDIFMSQWNRIKTLADWSKVFHTFGKKDGENLFQWMAGDFEYIYKVRFNKWFKDHGSSNRFPL